MPSVRESRAGDDFHYLWAARRLLALVDPASDLRLVRLEGPTPEDDPDEDDQFLGVDLIEYHGGDSLRSATRTVVSQLKYSTRHAETQWTVARLCKKRRPAANSSVIRRLADAWKGLAQTRRGVVVVALVSNQPVAPELSDLIAEVGTCGQARTFAELVAALPARRAELAQLKDRCALGSEAFVQFMRSLDFSACGAEPRVFQRLHLISSVGGLTLGSAADVAGDLVELVRATVMPEAKGAPGIKRAEVLAQLGVSSERDLFPAPQKFDPVPATAVPTADARSLADKLSNGTIRRLLAHGTYGVGKTTTVQQLEAHLPQGSMVVAYDCFGGGDYRNPSADRHVTRTALVQLANTVAVQCGLPPLVVNGPSVDADLWRRFEGLLESAASTIRPGALLVLAVDAADNSIFAGIEAGDETFIPAIWRLRIPEAARLLVTCRSQHRAEVGLGREDAQLELGGFDTSASTAMLRRFFPDASSADGAEFHKLTTGNPRLQTYVLESEPEAPSLERVLARAADGLEEVFKTIVDDAFERANLSSDVLADLAVMHAMSPPSRVSVLGEVLGVSVEKAQTLCELLAPGVLVAGDVYGFRDQSFDDFVRDRIGESRWIEANRRLAEFCRTRPGDQQAASALAGHLFNGGEIDDVIALAVEPAAHLAEDPLWEADIVRRRLHYGALAAAKAHRPEDLARVLLSAAHAARSDTTLVTALKDWPELAERFADPELLTLVHDRAESATWRGPTLMRTAALLAWTDDHQAEARRRLDVADGWISRWSRLPDDERRRWDLTARDIAAAAEAVFALEGSEACRQLISRWRPAEFRLSVSQTLVRRLVRRISPSEMRDALNACGAGRLLHAEAVALYADRGAPLPKAWVLACARAVNEIALGTPAFAGGQAWGTSFCLAVASAGASQRTVADLVDRLGTQLPRHAPHEYDDLADLVPGLTCVCLRHLAKRSNVEIRPLVDALLPLPNPEARSSTTDRIQQDRRDYVAALELLLPVVAAHVGLLRGTHDVDALRAAVSAPLERFEDEGKRWWFKGRHRFGTWIKAVASAAQAGGDAGLVPLRSCIDAMDRVAGETAAHLRLALGAQLVASESQVLADLGIELVEAGKDGVVEGSGTATERRDALFAAADVVLGADDTLAETCFRQALLVAGDIDDDAILEIAAAARLGSSCTGQEASERRRLAGRLTLAVERSVGRVSDDDHLPVRRVLDAEARLDVGAALRTATRWHHAGIAEVEDTIALVAKAAVTSAQIDGHDALGLAKLSRHPDDHLDVILTACEQLRVEGPTQADRLKRAVDELTSFLGRDVSADARSRAVRRAMEWSATQDLPQADSLDYVRGLAALLTDRPRASSRYPSTERDDLPSDFVLDVFDDDAVSRFFDDSTHRYASSEDVSAVLERSLAPLPPRHRVRALDRLLDLMGTVSASVDRALVNVIQQRIAGWQQTAGIDGWLAENIDRLASEHIATLLTVEGDRLDNWRVELRFPDSPSSLQAVCNAVATNLAEFTAVQLIALAEYIASALGENAQLALAQSLLAGLGVEDDLVTQSQSLGEDLAAFCWELFGSRDRRVRWRAAHAARHMLLESPSADLPQAWLNVLANSPGSADDPSHLTMSALLWAWMVTARAVDESPDRFLHLRDHASRVASDGAFPHASIREFARRVALLLSGLSGRDADTELMFANRPTLCAVERQSVYNHDEGYEATKAATFDFDHMDTVRYWYRDLAELFGLPTSAIVERADRWISEVWARTNEECTLDYGRIAQSTSWQLMSNDHGRDPTVENLQTYLEYHAMLVVAGELIDEREAAVVCEPYEDAGDPWERWLRPRIDSNPRWWLADRRACVPADDASQGLRASSTVWEEFVNATDLTTVLSEGDWLWADGHADWSDAEWRVNVSVSSALVTPEAGPALVRSLLTSTPPSAALPSFGADDFWNAEFEEDGFTLRGWVVDRHDFLDGLDDDDPFTPRGLGAGSCPSPGFVAFASLAPNALETSYVDPAGDPVVRQELWSNIEGDDGKELSSGNRLLVRRATLLGYAREHELDVVVGAYIDRYRRNPMHGRHDDDDENNRVCRVWIISHIEGSDAKSPASD